MTNVNRLKERFVKHLMEKDLSTLTMSELSDYAGIINLLVQQEKPDPYEALLKHWQNNGFSNAYYNPGAKEVS